MNQLPRFRKGQVLAANELNTLVDAINARTVLPSVGVLVRQTTNGVTLSVEEQRGRGGVVKPKPFELISTVDDATPMIRIVASTLAGGSALDIKDSATGTTSIFAAGDSPQCLLAPAVDESGVGYVQGGIKVDSDGVITQRWIEAVDTMGTDVTDADPTVHYVQIGTVSYDVLTDVLVVNNTRYGPIDAAITRDWFTMDPITYTADFYTYG